MFCQLGDKVFWPQPGFDAWAASNQASFAEHKRCGNRPLLQFLGPGLSELNLKLDLGAERCHPQQELDWLLGQQQAAAVLPLFLGNGQDMGHFVITSLQHQVQEANQRGDLLGVVVQLTLKEHEPSQPLASNPGFAMDLASAAPSSASISHKPDPAVLASQQLQQAGKSIKTIDGEVNDYIAQPPQRPSLAQSIQSHCQQGRAALSQLNQKLNQASQWQGQYSGLEQQAKRTSQQLERLRQFFPPTNLAALQEINRELQSLSQGLNGEAFGLINSIITRTKAIKHG